MIFSFDAEHFSCFFDLYSDLNNMATWPLIYVNKLNLNKCKKLSDIHTTSHYY